MKLTTIFLCSLSIAWAQSETDEMMYQAYLQRSQALWEKALATQLKQADTTAEKLRLAFAYYSLLNGTMATQNETLFDKHVDGAKELLKTLMEENPKSGEAAAMLSAIYGNEIAYSSMKGMFLGGKSSGLAAKGIKLEPASALVWRIYGTNKYYTPAAFGGDLEEALKAFEKSISIFESNPDTLKNNWLYIDTLALLGQAYTKTGATDKAIATYEKALQAEPSFGWVKLSLLPKAKKISK
jgi:tetratricopeptide (TPR) repeat protein